MTAQSVAAESLKMAGLFPPPERRISAFRTLGILPFKGVDGPVLSSALEEAFTTRLGPLPPHFKLLAPTRDATAAPDGVVSGVVTTGAEENRFTRNEVVCTSLVHGQCLAQNTVVRNCIRRVLDVSAAIRVTDNASGEIIYSRSLPRRDDVSWCDNQQPWRTAEVAIRDMINQIGLEFFFQVAPKPSEYKVVLYENTSGWEKPRADAFRKLVRQTQSDTNAACKSLRALAEDVWPTPEPALAFANGACAERAGDYNEAEAQYAIAAQGGVPDAAAARERATGLKYQRTQYRARNNITN